MLTGRGADVILIDDPLKPADAMSQRRRAAANEWFDSTLFRDSTTRQRGAIVIVMQRLHEDDLAGHVLEQDGWDVCPFPAIAEADELFEIETPAGRRFRRAAGEALNPERELLETLESIRSTIGEYNFAAQYQQTPAPAGGGMIKAAWFRRYPAGRPAAVRPRSSRAGTPPTSPPSSPTIRSAPPGASRAQSFYLLNVFRKKLSYPELKRAVVEQDGLFRPQAILIEDRASGTQLIQDLIAQGLSKVTRSAPDGDKIMRLHAQTATIENGFVFLPEDAPWLADYVDELALFPAGRHDDQVDFDRPGPRLAEAPLDDRDHRLLGGPVGDAAIRG